MSKYKLIISDYDGTLTGRDHIISEGTSTAIKKWQQSGRKFTLATGRQYLMIKNHLNNLGITTPVITRGGAEIVDPQTGEVLFTKRIGAETLQQFMQLLSKYGFLISIEVDEVIYSDYYNNKRFESNIEFKKLEYFKIQEVPKLVVFAFLDVETKEKIMEDIIKKFPELHIVKIQAWEGVGWDVTSAEATKHLMVLKLIKMLGLPREETVGVGNGYNDFPLLEACGLKVAMGNAPEDLKAIADIVVPSYQEDGVAVLIEKLLSEDK